MKMPEDFLLKISKLGSDFDSVADTVLQAGGEVVLAKVRSNLSSVVGRGTKYDSRTTGELAGALGLSPTKLNRDGNHDIKVGFAEPRSDGGDPVAVGFRAKKSNGKYKYYWLYRVKFGIPATNLATKGDSITFSTPTIEGTILRRNKADAGGKHPWKAEALEGDVTAATITNWYKEVYEPTYTTTPQNQG